MRNLVFWSLSPFTLPQAVWVRKTAPRFAAADGPRSGFVGSGERLKLLAVGDSIIAGVGAQHIENALVGQAARALAASLDCRVDWSAHGRIGAKSTTLLEEYLPGLPSEPVDAIIVSIGVNDITSLTAQAVWKDNLGKVLHALRGHSGNAVIAVTGIPPLGGFPLLPQPLRFASGQRGKAFDVAARRVIAGFPQAIHIPIDFDTTPDRFSADGFHPSESSYAMFGSVIAERIATQRQQMHAAMEASPDPAPSRMQTS
jgi:lysophospholipase L1-like esterase